LGLCLNIEEFYASQYEGFNFNSLALFNGVSLGANENGLFTLTGDTDNGVDIISYWRLIRTDFGIPYSKWLRKIVLSGNFAHGIVVKVYGDDDTVPDITFTLPDDNDTLRQVVEMFGASDEYYAAWSIEIGNVDGTYYMVDSIDAAIIPIMTKQQSNTAVSGRMRGEVPFMWTI
jgi:hypothetical protein